jgi:16S rRNA (cytosine1402-N4)-methyltransferase
MNISQSETAPVHIPVMVEEVVAHLRPHDGAVFVDGTFGAGGYTQALLAAANTRVYGIDRDPTAIANGAGLVAQSQNRLKLLHGTFADMQSLLAAEGIVQVDGIVLDIGVSSMQIDQAARGFSFMRDGPLDMRMSLSGPTAADHVNHLEQEALARVIYVLGEEPRSRAIARAIIAARSEAPLATTFDLVKAVERATGPQRAKDRTHPATRTFQALRIFVNAELDELAEVLSVAENLLCAGGRLVVVSFHSLEDRIVKRFFSSRSGKVVGSSRFAPETVAAYAPSFTLPFKGHRQASDDEQRRNPRSRSAKLRAGIRTDNPAWPFDAMNLDVPNLQRHAH